MNDDDTVKQVFDWVRGRLVDANTCGLCGALGQYFSFKPAARLLALSDGR